ncbi:MAG TPA: leucine--tRNA ligase [Bacillota bacterium]|nr:leucine--tRNA ligase [Bacillota bacterium]
MKRYNPKEIEPRWQQQWQDDKIYEASDTSDKPKKYILEYFPYPSGAAMHVGHVRNYTIGDVMSRHARMSGYNVLHPMGWDAFGLPAENYAIKTGISPQQAIAENTSRFKQQLTQMGFGYDWSREFASSDPDYYRWTQWFFELLFKKGLAYQKESLQWWCPVDKTVLANEQVEAGKCWRCGSDVEKKALKQWFFKITDYADRLSKDLDDVDWSDSLKSMQRNWIGRSRGAFVQFRVDGHEGKTLDIFTTRPDTLYGATFMVVAPEHPLVSELTTAEQKQHVNTYVKAAQAKTDVERQETDRKKTGVFTGSYAINPVNGEKLPIWVADYVLYGYGTGAIMAVPAHDERDHAFAQAFKLPVIPVIEPETGVPQENPEFRRSIVAVVRNPQTNEYLSINWGNQGGNLFIGGGREENEDIVVAAKREVTEETGYKNLKLVAQTDRIHHHYFAYSKNTARFIEAYGLLFDLVDDERTEQKLEADEQGKFSVEWIPQKAAEIAITEELHATCYRLLVKGECYHGEGVMMNSGPYDGMKSSDVREKIVADLEEKGVGKERINYKIRDWLISRQRYWGAPIPIVHCAQCAVKDAGFKLSINFYNQETWTGIASGTKTVESRALNPDEPERLFGNVQSGDTIKAVNKENGQEMLLQIQAVRKYQTLQQLYDDEEWSAKVSRTGQRAESYGTFEQGYAALADNYLETIQKQGIVAWHIKVVRTPVAVPEDQLPVVLPDMESYEPSGDGRSPLARVTDWVNTACPQCGGPAQRETDTMDGFACSSWYFLRFADPHNSQKAFADDKIKYWLPVDDYIGGAEHAVMHLLYARMWTKVMQDEGLIDFGEPFKALRNHGMILAPDGRKMSKSWGNVIAPDDIIAQGYGADSIRIMELFIGPWNQAANWSVEGMGGSFRFLQRIWALSQDFITGADTHADAQDDAEIKRVMHRVIKKVSADLPAMGYNTAIAALMQAVNELYLLKVTVPFGAAPDTWRWAIESLLLLLAPFVPHITEELWAQLGHDTSIHIAEWPKYEEQYLVSSTMTIAVQVNGKIRGQVEVPADAQQDQIVETAKQDQKVAARLNSKEIQKVVYVPGKLISFVVQ